MQKLSMDLSTNWSWYVLLTNSVDITYKFKWIDNTYTLKFVGIAYKLYLILPMV